jgi:membrane peptidoglycan carboxypeptidase
MPDGQKDYIPQNYDGKFRGPLQMKQTLPMSLNIPAVKTLYLVGLNNAIAMAKNLGITGLNQPQRYGLSLVLGGGEVKLLDHVNAFGTLATGGIKRSKTAILKIEDGEGEVLEEYKPNGGERVVEEKYVAMLDYAMSTNDFRASVFGENSPLRSDNRPIAAKTGTTNEFRDGWTIGYTPSIVVGVWAGNNDNSPMRMGADGVNVAAPIWRSYLDQTLGNSTMEKFPKYDSEDADKDVLNGKLSVKDNVKVCKIPGKDDEYCLANSACPHKEVKKVDFADVHTILWYVRKDDPRGDPPNNPEEDPQFKNWEKAVQNWYEKEKDGSYVAGKPPKDECDKDDFSKFSPSVLLKTSYDNVGFVLKLSTSIDSPYGVSKIEFFVGGDSIASGTRGSVNYTVPDEIKGSSQNVKVELTDKNGNKTSDNKNVTL